MLSYFIYGLLLTGFVQPVTVHWTWSNGFLVYPPKYLNFPPEVYFRDYAGGCNVHAVGGISALIGCIFIGPRIGRFDGHKSYHIPGTYVTNLDFPELICLITGTSSFLYLMIWYRDMFLPV